MARNRGQGARLDPRGGAGRRRVLRWPGFGLARARSDGWGRALECDDGLFRPLATVAAQPGGQRVSVLYQTAGLAESGRAWFDALAGASVKFLLQGQTPRQAMQSAAGLERVKGLLRSYEYGEAEQALQQRRREVSYQFLWDALGLAR